MNIVVGEYIRTKQGIIDKVILEYTGKCANPNCLAKHISCKSNYYDEEDIVKHSKNIIDLIEVGDFVKIEYFSNRYSKRVKRIFEVDCIIDKSVCFTNGYYTLNILRGEWSNQDKEVKPIIKSIVTKQQFSNMEYRV